MDNNPYQSPEGELLKTPPEGSIIKGVAWGALIDIGGSLLFFMLFGIGYATYLAGQGMNEQEIANRLNGMDPFSPVSLFLIAVGGLISYIAGYKCASKSGGNVKTSIIYLCIVSGGLGFFAFGSSGSFSEDIILTILTVSAISFGGWHWASQNS